MSGALERLASKRAVLLCCGSGGVGKTTTAAALGVAAALGGRRACVITVDPARRLADALGGYDVANEPIKVAGPWQGELNAVMLDAKTTFDALIERYATDAEQARRILSNRVYQNLASVLSGTQEYMATEKLFELHHSGQFDLVVVDTPPTRHALDFLDAPKRLEGFLSNRLFRAVVAPKGAYFRAAHVASQALVRSIAKATGAEIVDDTIAFFQAFQGMEEGFRERAARVEKLLSEDETGFILVAAPRVDAIGDAAFFAQSLRTRSLRVDALVVNRIVPDFGPAPPGTSDVGEWASLVENLVDLAELRRSEQDSFDGLASAVEPAPVVHVPYLERDVHDVEGLLQVVRYFES
ncbi:MAG: ArsA-related P-loop ATPase [Acidimicrobiales bacterium]